MTTPALLASADEMIKQGRLLLSAPSGHAASVSACPLLREERTYLRRVRRSVDDPSRTSWLIAQADAHRPSLPCAPASALDCMPTFAKEAQSAENNLDRIDFRYGEN
jgi:hypothetical protein